jgi:hypothetical protein
VIGENHEYDNKCNNEQYKRAAFRKHASDGIEAARCAGVANVTRTAVNLFLRPTHEQRSQFVDRRHECDTAYVTWADVRAGHVLFSHFLKTIQVSF